MSKLAIGSIETLSGVKVALDDLTSYILVEDTDEIRSKNLSGIKQIRLNTRGNPIYKLDTTDTTSVDDDFLVIVDLIGNRFKLIGTSLYLSSTGVTGVGDEKVLLKKFASATGFKNKYIDRDIYTSGVAVFADNSTVTQLNGAVVYATADVTSDVDASAANQGQVFESGNNCTFTGVKIDGQGNTGNGILNDQKTDVVIQLCDLGNGLGQAIHDFFGVNSQYKDNDLHEAFHGIQLWGTDRARVSGNHVWQVTGGIWSAVATDVLANDNIVHDCSDVGIDWEGGLNCHSRDNTIWNCNHGACTIFKSDAGLLATRGIIMGSLSHVNNEVRHNSVYASRTGVVTDNDLFDTAALMIYDLDTTLSGPIIFRSNTVHVLANTATVPESLVAITNRADTNTVTEYIEFDSNKVYTRYSKAFRLQELRRCKFINNEFHFMQANPVQHEIKNIHIGEVSGNKFFCEASLTPPSRALTLYTDKAMTGDLQVFNNEWYGFGDTAVYVDQFISNRVVKFGKNKLTSSFGSTTGGLETNNGYCEFHDQNFIYSIGDNETFDLSTKTGLYASERASGIGIASMQMGGASGPIYRVAVQTRAIAGNLQMQALDTGGAVSTGIFPNAARYITFGATTIQPQDTDGGTANSAMFSITMSTRA